MGPAPESTTEIKPGKPVQKEMDINPLIAYKNGAVAVDARIILDR
jgi:hypothetical protein